MLLVFICNNQLFYIAYNTNITYANSTYNTYNTNITYTRLKLAKLNLY